jgi:GTPase involved in cell partitioning and DNA repair
MGMIRFRIKFVCCTIGLVGVVLSASGQSKPKQALVRYQTIQQHLPDYDSLQQDIVVTSNECDSLLRYEEQKVEKAFQKAVGSCHANYSPEKNKQLEDSLNALQQGLMQQEEHFSSRLIEKQSTHDSLLLGSFHQLSLDFCKARSIDLLLEAAPLYSKEPVVDLTDEFILFLEENRKKK